MDRAAAKLAVAKDRGKITTNPCEKGARLYGADRSDKLWTDDHVKPFLEKAPKHLHVPLMLAPWTGQRQGDLLALPWSAYDGQSIRLRQRKGKKGNGRRVKIPVGAPLKTMLDRTQRVATVILIPRTIRMDGGRLPRELGQGMHKADIPDDLRSTIYAGRP